MRVAHLMFHDQGGEALFQIGQVEQFCTLNHGSGEKLPQFEFCS